MADHDNDTGSKDRATVALVGAKVDEVKAIVQGHAETTNAKLDGINEKIAPLAGLPDRVTRLEAKHDALADTVADIEGEKTKRWEWRRTVVGGAIVVSVGFLLNLAVTFHWFHP